MARAQALSHGRSIGKDFQAPPHGPALHRGLVAVAPVQLKLLPAVHRHQHAIDALGLFGVLVVDQDRVPLAGDEGESGKAYVHRQQGDTDEQAVPAHLGRDRDTPHGAPSPTATAPLAPPRRLSRARSVSRRERQAYSTRESAMTPSPMNDRK